MKLNVRGFSIAVSTVLAAAFSVCAFFVAVAPEATTAFLSYLLHINLTGLTQVVGWPSYFAGVLAVGVWSSLWAAVAAECAADVRRCDKPLCIEQKEVVMNKFIAAVYSWAPLDWFP